MALWVLSRGTDTAGRGPEQEPGHTQLRARVKGVAENAGGVVSGAVGSAQQRTRGQGFW